MIERVENIVMPATKLETKAETDNPDLDNFRCRRMAEEYFKKYLPDSTSLIIMWVDKNQLLSTAYCNVSFFKRIELYVVGILQEIFDIKLKNHGKE